MTTVDEARVATRDEADVVTELIVGAFYEDPTWSWAFPDPDLRRAQARMWQVLARRLAHHPAVFGYDLINEPMGRLRAGRPTAASRGGPSALSSAPRQRC